jgi:hypothetical protein|tara:strand:- start:1062 stop:1181 length:120 start_codon:yes stop_codon:yes gene_type:complete
MNKKFLDKLLEIEEKAFDERVELAIKGRMPEYVISSEFV